MASFLEKVETLISANPQVMIDAALGANSLAVFDQYIREVEDNLEYLEDAVVMTLRRKKADLGRKAAELDRNIDVFLQEGKDTLALAAQSRLNSTNRLIEDYEAVVERRVTEFGSLRDARLRLEAKLTEVRQEREELQVLLDLARSKTLSRAASRSLDELTEASDDDISRVAQAIKARVSKVSVRSEVLTGSPMAQMEEVLGKSALERQLAERRARLGLD